MRTNKPSEIPSRISPTIIAFAFVDDFFPLSSPSSFSLVVVVVVGIFVFVYFSSLSIA
jgi:hypothetical protein